MKIITTVGTSLQTNEPRTDDFGLSEENYSDEILNDSDFNNLVTNLTQKANIQRHRSSAEIASIEKIDPSGQAEIYLLCTETVLSRACGEAIKNYFGERVKEVKVMDGLQVKNVDRFKKEGVVNLLNQLERIAQGGNYWDDCVLNITGGYKAIIPIMTIVGQLKKLPTYYIFEEGDADKYELIEIPKMPIDYKKDVFEQYWEEFSKFGKNADEIVNRKDISEKFFNDCFGCFEVAGNDLVLNPVGKILWWNYRSDFFIFYSSNEVWNEIQQQKDIQRILATKFSDPEIRKNKTEIKQDHYVFDDGNNNNRIYYFEDNGRLFIYKTFENEEKARAYINTPFNEQNRNYFKSSSNLFRIKIKN